MNKTENLTWEEVYRYWQASSWNGPSVIKEPVEPVEIHIDWKKSGSFYGYDWLSRREFEQRKQTIENDLIHFLYFTKSTNKGTIHTLNMLIDAKSDEERAAIWIYSYAKELSDMQIQGDAYRYARQLCSLAWSFLWERFDMWHHAMKKLIPQIFTNHDIFDNTEFESVRTVVELARLNAALVMHEYVPVLYTSLAPGVRQEGYSLRID